jgi:hypothetical protein
MAAPSQAPLAFGLLLVVSKKLTCGNYNMWFATVNSALKGARLSDYILTKAEPPLEFLDAESSSTADGKKPEPKPNPAYDKWVAEDQIVLNYLFSSLSKEIFVQVATTTTAKDLWDAIQEQHASQSHARIMATYRSVHDVQGHVVDVGVFCQDERTRR